MTVISLRPRRYRRTPTKQIAMFVDQKTRDDLNALCAHWKRSQAAVVRHCIEFRIAHFSPDEQLQHEKLLLSRQDPPRRKRRRILPAR